MKTGKNKTIENAYMPKIPRSYSIDEVLAAGGPTAFANKIGLDTRRMFEEIASLPPDAFLTEDEFNAAMATLNASK